MRADADEPSGWARIATFSDRLLSPDQSGGAASLQTDVVLQQLVDALGPAPRSETEALAKWRQVSTLTARLNELGLDGRAGAAGPAAR